MSQIRTLKAAADKMCRANERFDSLLKSVLPIGTDVYVMVKHTKGWSWFRGSVKYYVADSAEVGVQPADDIESQFHRLIGWNTYQKSLTVPVNDVYLDRQPNMK